MKNTKKKLNYSSNSHSTFSAAATTTEKKAQRIKNNNNKTIEVNPSERVEYTKKYENFPVSGITVF